MVIFLGSAQTFILLSVVSENPLFGCKNVTFTPHVGANSEENLLRIGEEVIATIDKYHKEGLV